MNRIPLSVRWAVFLLVCSVLGWGLGVGARHLTGTTAPGFSKVGWVLYIAYWVVLGSLTGLFLHSKRTPPRSR